MPKERFANCNALLKCEIAPTTSQYNTLLSSAFLLITLHDLRIESGFLQGGGIQEIG